MGPVIGSGVVIDFVVLVRSSVHQIFDSSITDNAGFSVVEPFLANFSDREVVEVSNSFRNFRSMNTSS